MLASVPHISLALGWIVLLSHLIDCVLADLMLPFQFAQILQGFSRRNYFPRNRVSVVVAIYTETLIRLFLCLDVGSERVSRRT